MIYCFTRQADRCLGEIHLRSAERLGIRLAESHAADIELVFDPIAD